MAAADTPGARDGPYPRPMERDLRETPLYQGRRGVLPVGARARVRARLEPAGDPAPSPDGRWLAFRGERLDRLEGHAAGPASASSAPTARGSDRSPTGRNDDSEPRWSPDGDRLSFRSDRASKGRHQLYLLDTDGAGRGPAADHAAGHGRVAPVVGRRRPHARRARRHRRRAGRRARLGHARRGAGRARVGARGGVVGRRRGRATLAVAGRGRDRRGAPRLLASHATSGKPTGAATIAPSPITSEGAGEDAWYGAGVARDRPRHRRGTPARDERRAARMGRRLARRRPGRGDRGGLQRPGGRVRRPARDRRRDRRDDARRPGRRRRLARALARRRPAVGVRAARPRLARARGRARATGHRSGAVGDRRVGRRALPPVGRAVRRGASPS